MTTAVLIGLVLGIIVVGTFALVVRRGSRNTHVVDNTNRPARPEPGESDPVNAQTPRDR
ncbi:MAG TPA: hypothetical protein VHW00_03480 [Thermoanaerobaculia bacterium]|nr:hypothetical protein [Thermoanaerobaculia bacterium]